MLILNCSFFSSGLSLSCYICYSTISWEDCFNTSTVRNCKSGAVVCANTFTAVKQKDDRQKFEFTAYCGFKVGWWEDSPRDILFHLVGLAHAHKSATDFWKFFINFSKAVDANVCEFLLGIITILPFPMCVFFSIPFWLVIINPRVEAEFVEGFRGLGSQNISKPIQINV